MWRGVRCIIYSFRDNPYNHGVHIRFTTVSNQDVQTPSIESCSAADDLEDDAHPDSPHVENIFQNPAINQQIRQSRYNFVSHTFRKFGLTSADWEQYTKQFNVADDVFATKNEAGENLCKSNYSNISDPDVFGSLDDKHLNVDYEGDERDDKIEYIPHSLRKTSIEYADLMEKLVNDGKMLDALAVLREEMPAARVNPTITCYRRLIYGFACTGDVRTAFKLYNDMKKRGIKPNMRIIGHLFKACYRCPEKKEALKYASKLRTQLQEKQVLLSEKVYHAMIRTFGALGDLATSFALVDEMIETRKIDTSLTTYCHLLEACKGNQEAGFRYAVLVWRRMRQHNLTPNACLYNNIIQCTKLDAGDPELLNDFLNKIMEDPCLIPQQALQKRLLIKGKPSKENKIILNLTKNEINVAASPIHSALEGMKYMEEVIVESALVDGSTELEERSDVITMMESSNDCQLINVLAHRPSAGSVLQLTDLSQPWHRLALLGGCEGVLDQMKRDHVTPNIITFSSLLTALPPQSHAEENLLKLMKLHDVPPNTQFMNILIHRRCIRRDYEAAKEVLPLMQLHEVSPDIITYCSLALTCTTLTEARGFLADMERNCASPSYPVLRTLLNNALHRRDYFYALEMLQTMHMHNLPPCEQTLRRLEEARDYVRHMLRQHEGKAVSKKEKATLKSYRIFLLEYKHWLRTSKAPIKDAPWAFQLQEPPRVAECGD